MPAAQDIDAYNLEDFQALGSLARAGMKAVHLACERGLQSAEHGRIPISGAVVSQVSDGTLQVVTVGCNGRIPAPHDQTAGYPTDHGETGAVRCIKDCSAVDWGNSVFATTLSPCIMCTRTIEFLHSKGLRSLVIAESTSFQGPEERLTALPGMNIVRLSDERITASMLSFARRYPWDWAADIGEVPPRAFHEKQILDKAEKNGQLWWDALGDGEAAVYDAMNSMPLSHATDARLISGENPCNAAVLCAMGKAGSSVNLRECAVVWKGEASADMVASANLTAFGNTSLGACELFKPAVLVTRGPVARCLCEPLRSAGVRVIDVGTKVQDSVARSPRARSRSR